MIIGIIKLIASIIAIFLVSFLVKHYYEKIKLKGIIKKVIIGVIFGALSIGCSLLSFETKHEYLINLSYTSILAGGLIFGGPVGIIAGVIAGIERLIVGASGTLVSTKLALTLSLVFTGALATFLKNIINKNEKFKVFYTLVLCAICDTFNGIMIFLTNMHNLESAYKVVSETIFLSVAVNVCGMFLITFVIALIFKEISFKKERPRSIHSKVQLNLGAAMIVGLIAVISIAYGVLDNISKESVKSTINMSINDTISNVKSDITVEIQTKFSKFITSLKQSVITLTKDPETLTSSCNFYDFSTATMFNKDGTIFVSNDPYFSTVTNVYETEFGLHVLENYEATIFEYKYIEAKNDKTQVIYQWYNKNNEDLYILAEVDSAKYVEFIKKSIEKGIASRHIGEDGLILVSDKEEKIISSPVEIKDETTNIKFDEKNLDIVSINGEDYYYYVVDFEGYFVTGLVKKASSDLNKNISIYITALTAIIVFFALYLIIFFSIKSTVIKPLVRVNDSLDKICDGKLEEKVSEYSSKELKFLSDDINQTVDSLKEYMGKEAKLIQNELNFAKEIQYSALPSTFPPFPNYKEFELFAYMLTAKEVGGDFYDFYLVDDRHLCILIADVSGKGVPAALFMMQSKSLIKSYIESQVPIAEAMTLANQKICETNTKNMFVTIWCGIIDLDTGDLEYVNAGHNQPLIKNGTDGFVFLDCKAGFVFGAMEMFKYKSQKIKLEKNSIVYLYTDGVNEATNTNEELYGNDRMNLAANCHKEDNCTDFCMNMLNDVKDFTKDAEQSDDITQLCFKYFGK